MTFMFGFNFDNIVSTRTTVMTLVFITCYHTTMALLNFENLFCLPAKKVIPCVPFCFKRLYLHDIQACKYHLNYCSPITVFSCHMMFPKACGMFGMLNVGDVGYSGSGMLGDVGDVGCLRYGMFRMWDVRDVGCLGCGMLDVQCLLGCGILVYQMPSFIAVKVIKDFLRLFHNESNLNIDFSSSNCFKYRFN